MTLIAGETPEFWDALEEEAANSGPEDFAVHEPAGPEARRRAGLPALPPIVVVPYSPAAERGLMRQARARSRS